MAKILCMFRRVALKKFGVRGVVVLCVIFVMSHEFFFKHLSCIVTFLFPVRLFFARVFSMKIMTNDHKLRRIFFFFLRRIFSKKNEDIEPMHWWPGSRGRPAHPGWI